MHAVVALALPTVEAFDLAIPAQVFADPGLPRRYEFTVCAPAAGLVRSTTGYSVQAEHGLEALAAAVGEADTSKNGDSTEVLKSFVGTDAQTGQPVLQLPLPSHELLARGSAALRTILTRNGEKR